MTREELQALVEQIPIAGVVMQEGRIFAANQRMADLTGYTLEQLTSARNPIFDFVQPEDQAKVAERSIARQRGEQVADEYDFLGRGARGEKIPARVRISRF